MKPLPDLPGKLAGIGYARVERARNCRLAAGWNLWHDWEHYGNVVVYRRMKGLGAAAQ
jgi:hypothetical protein